uniref:Uncharacterized protein n=1 Tax=Anguilla anguilla TaxID=7936 RepID=A0A0E9TVF7_ANGAN
MLTSYVIPEPQGFFCKSLQSNVKFKSQFEGSNYRLQTAYLF